MALEMMFQDTSTEVNVSSQGGKKASRMIDNIASKPTDNGILKTLESAGSAARQYNATQSTLEATQAKQDYLKLMMSPEYRDGSSSNRAEALESIYKNNSANKSQAYTDAFTTYSSGQYMQEYDKREIEVDNSYYEQAGASYTAYMDADSNIQHPAWKEGYDEDMRYMTNKEAGRTPADFVETYQALRPRLDKVVIGTGIVKDLYGEMAFNISMASNPKELKEALVDNEEMKIPFKSPFFLENKSKQGQAELSKLDTQLANVVTTKRKQFKSEALTRVELGNDSSNEEPANRYINMPNADDYHIAYEDKAPQKFNDDMHKYVKHEKARITTMNMEPNIDGGWGAESDLTKEMFQAKTTMYLNDAYMSGNVTYAGNTILKQGSIDTSRVKDHKQAVIDGLTGGDKTAAPALSYINNLQKHNAGAFNILFNDPKERAKVLAVGAIHKTQGMSIADSWNYVQGQPTYVSEYLQPHKKMEISKITNDPKLPRELKQDYSSMYSAIQPYVGHDAAMDALETYKKSEPYSVTFNVEKESIALDMYNWTLNKDIPENGSVSQDAITNTITITNEIGAVDKIIDISTFTKTSDDITNIVAYNKDHVFSQGIEKSSGRIAEVVSDIVETRLTALQDLNNIAINAGSWVDYMFKTKVDVDGNVIDREPWKAPHKILEGDE